MFWTQQAFHEKLVRPRYKPVLEAFDSFAHGDEDARSVFNKLREQFGIGLIHNSLVDLIEHERLNKTRGRLVVRVLELLHKEEVPPCDEYQCKRERERLHEKHNEDAE